MVDAIYYRDAGRFALARRISAAARRATFYKLMNDFQPTASTTILDIGTSDSEGLETNMLEQLYPWGGSITAAGLGAGQEFRRRYPDTRYVQLEPGRPLPFKDKSFDIVFSNAVLEHVGGQAQRAEFIKEAARVGHRLFFIVPNRWFPIEHHTAIPFMHWNPGLFRRALKNRARAFWCDPRNMEFLSRRSLLKQWPLAVRPEIVYSGVWLGPFSSNLIVKCDLIVRLDARGRDSHRDYPE
jgi:SAM-dependent methyltransferase